MDIHVYTTPTCPYCRKAKAFLDENNVSYKNIDVSSSREAAQEMIDKSGQMGVPVIIIDGEVIVGFNRKRLEELLNIR
ncbi:MAG: glutathione S-transferase N-terminal domain-containing protein [Elusimicrobia bacterium]|nr:glutathione S-transferase N-terminal domain-containing protein [Elusimicrobiota bacterium]